VTSIKRQVPIEECLNGKTREESNLDDESIEDFVSWTKEIEKSEALREAALERLDEDNVPEATDLLWIDQAEVYPLCAACYRENQDGSWTGSTSNPNYDELRQTMSQKVAEGTPCAFCKDNHVDELKSELREDIDVEVVIVE